MLEPDFQRWRDAVDVRCQQLVAEVPWRIDRRPRLARLLVGAEQHAVALLASVDLALEVEHANHLAAGAGVELLDLRHRLGEQVHVLHGQKRQLEADHPADLARPQAAAIDHVLGLHSALLGDDVPGAVCLLGQFDHTVPEHDLGAQLARGLGVGMRGARWVEMAFDRVPHGADEIGLVHQREHRLCLGRRDQFGIHAEIATLGVGKAQEVHAFRRVRQHHAAGQVE